jgi:CRISPR-associated protein Csd2
MSNIVNNRYEFVILFDVKNGNPNGDPDNGNRPRTHQINNDEYGYITDVCIKHKIRNYIELVKGDAKGYQIYVKSGVLLNDQDDKAFVNAGIVDPAKATKEQGTKMIKFMCDNFWDHRVFGAVMTKFAKAKGVLGNYSQVRGPVQLNFAESINPIYPEEVGITRCTVTTQKEADDGKVTMMGNKWIVPYGLYRMEGYISASFANKTGFSESDLELLWESILNMFEHDHSATRGKMTIRGLYIFKHESALGNCHANILFDKIKVEQVSKDKQPSSFTDYEVIIDRNMPRNVTFIEKF